ncbi:hypothetical protein F2Q70_00003008 [Brassica cretica]|uniref:Uncharacterized protein n=1 Tax=Brassica cretica TaxID=69181 RepID=A0A8S9IZT7_BRACR|nr:hypothetical protein F2Q70_00003008 [Brassica cretica]
MTEMSDEGSQGGQATATETDGVISEPISVLVGAVVAVTSGEENTMRMMSMRIRVRKV